MTVTKNSENLTQSSESDQKRASSPSEANSDSNINNSKEMDAEPSCNNSNSTPDIKYSSQSDSSNNKLNSKLNTNRCLICFKLVKSLKGSKLTKHYDLNSVLSSEFDENDSFLSDGLETFSHYLQNGDDSISLENRDSSVNNSSNINQINNSNSNLVRSPGNSEKKVNLNKIQQNSCCLENSNECVKNERTIGDKVFASLKCSETYLNKTSIYFKKICHDCFRQVCLIDFHTKSARRLTSTMTLKLKKSSQLIGSSTSRLSRTMSACNLAIKNSRKTRMKTENGFINDAIVENGLCKRKAAEDGHKSSLNILTKIARNESSHNLVRNDSQSYSTSKIPLNRNSTILHIENLLKNADPHTLLQMHNLANAASAINSGDTNNISTNTSNVKSNQKYKHANGNINNNSLILNTESNEGVHVNNFKSIHQYQQNLRHMNPENFSMKKQQNSSSTSLNNKLQNYGKNTLVNQNNQNNLKTKQDSNNITEMFMNNRNFKTKMNWNRSDMSDVSQSSYKSNQFEQKQQQQEMGSRRKRKSINPSRLMKDNLMMDSNNTDLNNNDPNALNNEHEDLGPAKNSFKKEGQVHNGFGFERRHHSADSFPVRFNNPNNTKHGSKSVRNKNMQSKPIKVESCFKPGNGDCNEFNEHSEAIKSRMLMNDKENEKNTFVEHVVSHQNSKLKHENSENTDGEDNVNEYIDQNGIEDECNDNETGQYLINESEHDIETGNNEINHAYLMNNQADDDELQEEREIDDMPDLNDQSETEIDIDIDEVEADADAEDDDELDEHEQETDEEEDDDYGSIENDENIHMLNGLKNKPVSSTLKRRKLNLANGSINNNNIIRSNNDKLSKKAFNKNEPYKIKGKFPTEFTQRNGHNNIELTYKNNSDQERFVKNGFQPNQIRTPKKFNLKNSHENMVRNGNGNNNGNFYMNESNPNFVSPSLSDSPSPSQMVDTSPMSRPHLNNNYMNVSSMNISSHTSNTKHACEVCKKTFKTQNILRQHMRIHTGDKPFVCEICNKAFSQMASLKYHLATHSDARPYRCEVCSKTFKLKPPFKKHIKECQPKMGNHQNYQHSSSPSQLGSFNYYNPAQFNVNSNGLELDNNEDDE